MQAIVGRRAQRQFVSGNADLARVGRSPGGPSGMNCCSRQAAWQQGSAGALDLAAWTRWLAAACEDSSRPVLLRGWRLLRR